MVNFHRHFTIQVLHSPWSERDTVRIILIDHFVGINEPITDQTEVVYGFDSLSKMPKNLKIVIKLFKSPDEFNRNV
jgi:hypothetical protein